MIEPLPTAPKGFNRVLVAIDKFTKWIKVKPVTCPKADRVLDFLDELVNRYELPQCIITYLDSNFNNHQFPVTTDKLSAPTRWYSTPSRSDCMTQLTPKEASGSRNYPMHSWGFALKLPSQQGSHPTF
jgi:hypothetical protein